MWTRLRERSGIALGLIVAAALGLGFAAAAAKKPKPAHHASQTASKGSKAKIAAKGSKGKLAYNGRRKGSLAKAKATALAKAKVGTRHKKGSTPETTSATVTPPSAPARDLFGAQKVPSPLAASMREPGVFCRKRRIGSSFCMPRTES